MIGFTRLGFATLLLATATLDAEAAASLTLSKASGPPTTALTVALKGFAAGKLVDVYVDTTATCLLITSGTGAGSCSLAIPDAAQPGTHWITAAVRATGTGLQKSFLVRTDWPDHHGLDQRHDGFNRWENTISTKNAHLLEPAWAAAGTMSTGSAVVAAGKVYVGSSDGKLHAFDALTGAKVAGFPVTLGPQINYSAPTIAGGIVYVVSYDPGTSKGTLHARDATKGTVIAGFPILLSGQVRGAPVVVSGKLYIGASDHKLYGFNAKTGAALANFPVTVGASAVFGTPAYSSGMVFFGDTGGGFHGYDLAGNMQLSTSVVGGFDLASPAVVHENIYYASSGEHKLRLITTWGSSPWAAPFTMPFSWDGTPAVARGKIFVGDQNSTFSAVDAATATAVWSRNLDALSIAGSATVANGVVFVATAGQTYALDAADGALLWSYGIGQTYGQSIAVVNGMVYVTSYNRSLTAFRIKGAAPDAAMAAPAIADLKPDLSLKPR